MNRLSIALAVALVAQCLASPYHHHDQHGHRGHQSDGIGDSEYQQSSIGGGHSNYGSAHNHGVGHGGNHHELSEGLGHGAGGGFGQQQQQHQQYSGAVGGGSNSGSVSGFSKKRVEVIDAGSQNGFGQQSGNYGSGGHHGGQQGGFGGGQQGGFGGGGHQGGQQGGFGIGGSGQQGGFGAGGSSSQYGSQQSSGHKGLVVEETSGFSSVNKNQGGYQNNKHGSSSSGVSGGGYGSRY